MSNGQVRGVAVPYISEDLREFYRWWWWQTHLPIEEVPRALRREGLCSSLTCYYNNVVGWTERHFHKVYQEQRDLLMSMYGTRLFPFETADAYFNDEATYTNERRRTHVQQFL